MRHVSVVCCLAAILGAPAVPRDGALAQEVADTIHSGGLIVTIDDAAPRAEAVAVKDGRIIAVGSLADVAAHRGEQTVAFELDGRAMLPGFVDSHGHVVMGGLQALSANLLAPPDGEVRDIADLQDTLRTWSQENAAEVESASLIVGFGYDSAQLAELRHPTRDDLDAVSTEVPIIVVHQSGHFGAANSRALELAGITADTPDPAGGIIRRRADGEPDGVLEENAFFLVLGRFVGEIGEEGFEAFAASFGHGSDIPPPRKAAHCQAPSTS